MVGKRRRRPPPPLAPLALALAALAGCATPAAERFPAGAGGRGDLRVASVPAGARIVIDGNTTPYRTPTTVPGLAAGERRVLLTLAGHRNWDGVATVTGGGVAELAARLEPAATGSLAIASVPAGAAVWVDGLARGATPLALEGLAVGTSALQLRRDGYLPWTMAVVVLPGRRLELEAHLTPSPRDLGSLSVQSRPPNARVLLDGFPTGFATPATLHGITAGRHRVEMLLPGHRPWQGEVTVREGCTEGLLVTLTAEKP